MKLFGKESKRPEAKLVVTGKRVRGTWMIESSLPARARRSQRDPGLMVDAENRRVRTLH
jgi:hypothetical protein